jgi:hypothetical protein
MTSDAGGLRVDVRVGHSFAGTTHNPHIAILEPTSHYFAPQ